MQEYKEWVHNIISYFDNVKEEYSFYKNQDKQLDGLKVDIRHILEFASLNAVDMVQLTSLFKKKLIERREVINRKKVLCRLHGVFKKYEDFKQELEYVLSKIEQDINKEKSYYAKSDLGQQLIDRYSTEEDDLVKSLSEGQLGELKEVLENS